MAIQMVHSYRGEQRHIRLHIARHLRTFTLFICWEYPIYDLFLTRSSI